MVTAQQFKSPYNNLKIIIEKQEQTQKDVADKMDMNRSTFNLKINRTNGRDFSLEEAKRLSEILKISIDNFFELKVSKTKQKKMWNYYMLQRGFSEAT